MKKRQILRLSLPAIPAVLLLTFASLFYSARYRALNPKTPSPLSTKEEEDVNKIISETFFNKNSILFTPEYMNPKDAAGSLFINAASAILADASTGTILFEKNADEIIPPASMTKLVEMYVVLEHTANGDVSLSDEVPLPKESWAVNLPKDASIMFLAQGQHVTLDELLLGLAVASGNDASIAIASYVSGSMNDFVYEMNSLIRKLGLTKTYFVESSGYSEENLTTAREFASFSKIYLEKFPFTIKNYHSKKLIEYPLEKNLPDAQKGRGDIQKITQYNTNKLLGVLPGCDGLKTGFITESGYNIALTAERNGMRLISVTMRGPGNGSKEGNLYRTQDGTALMEYGFYNFFDYKVSESQKKPLTVPLLGSKEKEIFLIPAVEDVLTFPSAAEKNITVEYEVPGVLYGKVCAGSQYGNLIFKSGETVLKTVPLIASKTSPEAGFLQRIIDFTVYKFCFK